MFRLRLRSKDKDSTKFIKKVSFIDNVTPENILVTMYVSLIYTSIPNKEGFKATEMKLKRKNLPSRVNISFLKFILTLNNFIFNYTDFLTIKRCAMGTKYDPTYANIFMGIFEETHLSPNQAKSENIC